MVWIHLPNWDLGLVVCDVQPNQNPQESSHWIMKQTNSGKLHASTEYCIKHTIPEILANFWSSTNFDYVSDAGPLPTAMLTQAYDKSCRLTLQEQPINMELNGTTYHGYVVSLRLRSDVSLTQVQAKNYTFVRGEFKLTEFSHLQWFLCREYIQMLFCCSEQRGIGSVFLQRIIQQDRNDPVS